MEFLKNHYEKVLLGVVLLGLAIAVALLPMKVQSGGTEPPVPPPPKTLASINLSTNDAVLQKLDDFPAYVLSGDHNLFNPVVWKRRPDGTLLKLDENSIGPRALKIEKIIPLYTILSYDNASGTGYVIGFTQQTNRNFNLRAKRSIFAESNEKTDFGTILQASNSGDNAGDKPAQLRIQLRDGGGDITVTRGTPYKRLDGYAADLRYDPANLVFRDKRIGDALVFEGDTNNIVDVGSNYVVLSESSGKRTTIKYRGTP
ncbi:MAG: hypothetical protein M1608_09625 [Candidatus Omnitrophica bacterium]|nr:hypothetical protein [Candidatus Omnitrophota bacterium]